jgi:oligoendopeptidase F
VPPWFIVSEVEMLTNLPKSTEELLTWDWTQFEPAASELTGRVLTAENAAAWLQDWSDLSAQLLELYNRLYLATAVNTADAAAEKAYTHYIEYIFPPSMALDQEVKQKFLASGLEPAGFEVALRNMRAEVELYRERKRSPGTVLNAL